MKIHEVCAYCTKTCKKPWTFWNWQMPASEYCDDYQEPLSKISWEDLQLFIIDMEFYGNMFFPKFNDLQKAKFEVNLQFLKELQKCYLTCDFCGRHIAPDETFEIENEQTKCQTCVKEEFG